MTARILFLRPIRSRRNEVPVRAEKVCNLAAAWCKKPSRLEPYTNQLQTPVNEQVVWLALSELGRRHLLSEQLPDAAYGLGVSRRELMRKVRTPNALLSL